MRNDKEISGSFSDYLSLMLGKPRIRLNNLKSSLRFPCLGLNPIIDSIDLSCYLESATSEGKASSFRHVRPLTTKLRNNLTFIFFLKTRTPHAGANARLQLLVENSKSKKGHNYVKIEDYRPYWYGFPL